MKNRLRSALSTLLCLVGGIVVGVGAFLGIQELIRIVNKNQHPPLDFQNTEIIRRDYAQNQNFNLIEFPHREQMFLGPRGLQMLNRVLNERLPFGPEIDQLKYIAFNNSRALPDVGLVGGQYRPSTMELDIDTRRFIDQGFVIRDDTTTAELNARVEYVYATILHEYGHHLANTYITAIEPTDPQNYNVVHPNQPVLAPSNQKNVFLYKNVPVRFFEQWMRALHYDDPTTEQYELNQSPSTEAAPIFQSLSSKQLFEAANSGWTYRFDTLANSTQTYNAFLEIEPNHRIALTSQVANLVNYSYGVDELFTRQLVSLNYLPTTNHLLAQTWDAYTPDVILRNQMVLQRDQTYAWKNQQIFAVDNIFGGLLTQSDGTTRKISSQAQNLLATYQEVIGYGKLISQLFFNNENNNYGIPSEPNSTLHPQDFHKIKFGGFIPLQSRARGLIIRFKNQPDKVVRFAQVFKAPALQAKATPDAQVHIGNSPTYQPYISEEVDLSSADLTNIDAILVWNDDNGNGEYEHNESDAIGQDALVSSRPVTTFRETLKLTARKYQNYDQPTGDVVNYGPVKKPAVYEIEFTDQKPKLTRHQI